MRVYIPVADAFMARRAYTDKKKALKALERAKRKVIRERPYMTKYENDKDTFRLESFELAK